MFLVITITTVRLNITGSYEGFFLLRGEHGSLFELKDDVFLGEGRRYITGIDFEHAKQFLYGLMPRLPGSHICILSGIKNREMDI
jgi:hypothetical protein